MRIRHFIAWGVLLTAGSIVILCRNPTLNPADFFDRTFEEYKNGFAANGIYRNTKPKKKHFLTMQWFYCRGRMAWPWKNAPNNHEKDVQAESHFDFSELDRVCWLLWLDEGGAGNCFWLLTQRQQLLIILTRSQKEKRIDSELVSSLPATPPLETRSVLTLALDGRLVTQEPLTWASQPGESRDQRTWRSSTSSSGTWTRTRTTRHTVRTQRLSILAPIGGV